MLNNNLHGQVVRPISSAGQSVVLITRRSQVRDCIGHLFLIQKLFQFSCPADLGRDEFVVLCVLFVICVLVVFFCFFLSNRKTRSLLYTALYGRFKLQTNVVWFLNSNGIFRPSSNLLFPFFFWFFMEPPVWS